jgi:ATP-binding cassette subfamily F protein uup
MSYLGDFLFAPARARSPVKSLSGGEKNRLLLARLFTKPSNLIIMDEPTNDLDLETLELLEEKLVAFDGTLLLVSHDRAFLDNVVTSVFVLDGSGEVDEFVGGYSDWMDYVKQAKQAETAKVTQQKKPAAQIPVAIAGTKKKLSFKEQQELDKLPELISELETRQALLNQQISAPEFYKQDQVAVAKTLDELKLIDAKLEQVYLRWDELEALS